MNCKKCFAEHNGNLGSGRFCSIHCARSYASLLKREEINRKVSLALSGRVSSQKGKRRRHWDEIKRQQQSQKITLYWSKRTFENCSWDAKRKRVISEQNNCCLNCGIDDWNGKPLILEVNHIDGDRQNNNRNNLEALCPNCHSQTPTDRFMGRKHSDLTKAKLKLVRERNKPAN